MSDRSQSYASRQQGQRDDIAVIVNTVDVQQQKFADLLPSTVSWADFRNAFLTAVQSNSRLLEADRQSLWLALQKAAADGLKPDGREGAMVIFGDDTEDEDGRVVASSAKGKKKVVWVPMVWGLLKTVRNAEEVKTVTVECVYRGEHIVIQLGDDPKFEHRRSTDPEFEDEVRNVIGAYAIVSYKNGAIEREWMSRRQLNAVKAVSRAKRGPWSGPFETEQQRKTVLRRLMKRLDRTPDLRRLTKALESDETLGIDIDGEKPTEIMDEFSAEKQTAKSGVALSNGAAQGNGQHAPDSKRATAKTEPTEASHAPDPPRESDRPSDITGSTSAASSDFDYFALDPFGDPIPTKDGDLRYTRADHFAIWYNQQWFQTPANLRDALREQNADALADARKDPVARTAIAATEITTPSQEAKELTGGPTPIPLAYMPNGRQLAWAKYATDYERELKGLHTDAEIDAWVALQEPTHKGKATAAYDVKFASLVKARREELKPAAPKVDHDALRASDLVALVNAATQLHELEDIRERITTRRLYDTKREDILEPVNEAFRQAYRRLESSTASTPPPSDEPQWEEYGVPTEEPPA